MSDDREADPQKRPKTPIVGKDFDPPLELLTEHLVLVPLGPEHNDADYRAWTTSIAHIQATPGFGPPHNWPPADGMPIEENLSDLSAHRADFDDRTGFTYSVLDIDDRDRVVGCLYIYADPTGANDVEVRSWVTAERAELDRELWAAVSAWMTESWPFKTVRYAHRD